VFYSVDSTARYMLWLYEIPTWLLAVLIVGSTVLLALGGLRLIHRRLNGSVAVNLIDNGTVGWFFSGVTVLYGLTLGLLTVATWQNYTTSSGIASQEAASLAVLYRDLSGYPASVGQPLQRQLRTYATNIVQQSWPAQRKGMANDQERVLLTQFQGELLHIEVTSMSQQVLHGQAIETFNKLVELRRPRRAHRGAHHHRLFLRLRGGELPAACCTHRAAGPDGRGNGICDCRPRPPLPRRGQRDPRCLPSGTG
jgi:hypothetical protein